ncbi:MAG: zf-HC2 domain-containing protein [Candidatus Eisenbacteria bacterium]
MNCQHARKLFAASWDDETTQAEREWLEGHFTSCPACRRDYDHYTRTVEMLGSLPRVEPAPDLPERVLQRVRRTESVPDHLPAARPLWVPVGSAMAAGALIALTLAGPWLSGQQDTRTAVRLQDGGAITEPVLVQPPSDSSPLSATEFPAGRADQALASADSVFDHSEDVEFILDPVTLHRGRASVNRTSGGQTDEKAVITF